MQQLKYNMDIFEGGEPIGWEPMIVPKIIFYKKNKTIVTFRSKQMPEYFFTGVIEDMEESVREEGQEVTYWELGHFILKLENGEKMFFNMGDILEPSIHPASINPIRMFLRTDIPEETRKKVFERCDNKCEIMSDACTGNATEIDHIIPVSRGGTNELYNLQGACSKCNKTKSNKL